MENMKRIGKNKTEHVENNMKKYVDNMREYEEIICGKYEEIPLLCRLWDRNLPLYVYSHDDAMDALLCDKLGKLVWIVAVRKNCHHNFSLKT